MATAKKLPSGSWRCQVYAGKGTDGKKQYLSFTRPTKKEAEYDALQYQLHYREISRDSSAMTLDEAVERYIKSKDGILSPSTIRGYEMIHRNHLKGLMPLRLNRITPRLVQEAMNEEAKPYIKNGKTRQHSPKTLRNIHGLLRAVVAEYHPALVLNTTLPQREHIEQRILEPEQMAVLLEAIKGNAIEIPILLALWLGMRASEICALTWDCVDLDNATVTIRKALVKDIDNQWVEKGTKTVGSTRTVNLPDYIVELLRQARAGAGGAERIIRFNGMDLYNRFKTILRRAGLPPIRLHDLRHTNASVMAALNVPDLYAQKRGGWSSGRVMKSVYQHTINKKRNAVDEVIDSYFYGLLHQDEAGDTPLSV